MHDAGHTRFHNDIHSIHKTDEKGVFIYTDLNCYLTFIVSELQKKNNKQTKCRKKATDYYYKWCEQRKFAKHKWVHTQTLRFRIANMTTSIFLLPHLFDI